jgi:hypothetical protein
VGFIAVELSRGSLLALRHNFLYHKLLQIEDRRRIQKVKAKPPRIDRGCCARNTV